ncbi:MAG TPA: hypothetical protein VFU04_04815, partial [Solirubrobacterales bacterium]|nr:hypothetical protein [Solirubrobacterales bacterium]
MRGEAAERFVVASLRLMALGFAVVGLLFVASPSLFVDGTDDRLWQALAFAYMVVITGLALVIQADVVRYRPLLLVLAAGKAASSLGSLAYYAFEQDHFVLLLNFLVDGFLAVAALWLWSLAGRVERSPAPG